MTTSLKEGYIVDFSDNNSFVYDRNGNEIHNGDLVIWIDPETGLETEYEVDDEPTEDLVRLYNKNGECEALPIECIVVRCTSHVYSVCRNKLNDL